MEEPAIALTDARAAGLRYVDDRLPGITRKRTRGGFSYLDVDGTTIRDKDVVARIKALAVPPAYKDVWISPLANGHIQATGRDARGRKQYRYHAKWREVRDANKFESTIGFAKVLPELRARIARDLRTPEMGREHVLASVLRMLERTLIRVGNESYARDNDSYGLTTLRGKHVRIEGGKRIRLRFRGKSGIEHEIAIEDKRLADTVKRCRDLPGETLFNYLDDAGEAHPVTSDDVNAYIRATVGDEFSAKSFRTWTATVLCALALDEIGAATSLTDARRKLKEAMALTAKRLGNTIAVCRKAYVHPLVVETYLDELALTLPASARAPKGLDADERRVLRFLERGLKTDGDAKRLALLRKSVTRAKRGKAA